MSGMIAGGAWRWLLVVALAVLGGCAQMPHASVVGEQERIEIPERPMARANGGQTLLPISRTWVYLGTRLPLASSSW